MQFINNWSRAVTLAAGATSLALDLPDGEYRLTITDSQFTPTRWEIVGATVAAGTATLVRALEATADQDWPAGSVIYCAVTAGTLTELFARLTSAESALTSNAAAIADLDGRIAALEPSDPVMVESSSTTTTPTGIFGYSPENSAGSISPAGATVYPDGTIAPGGVGEITELGWSGDYPFYNSLYLRVRGGSTEWPNVDALPFTSMTIGTTTLAKADASLAGVTSGQSLFTWSGIGNPFVDGNNAVTFA